MSTLRAVGPAVLCELGFGRFVDGEALEEPCEAQSVLDYLVWLAHAPHYPRGCDINTRFDLRFG